ncbi:MAG: PQQ-dependent sugar dehydrogenase [Chloroflexota bacterium]
MKSKLILLLLMVCGGWLLIDALRRESLFAFDLPAEFENVQVVSGLADPDGFAFSPDGRLFISERITGRLLVAKYDNGSDRWQVNSTPFYTFDIPKDDSNQPEARRSAGLRDIAFDPDFATNGYIYAYYMKDDLLHNRVVRLKADTSNPDVADASFGEELLIDLPFNSTFSSGSHNGGALEFGSDGMLYITTGDGWTGEFAGDSVQSLTTYTGKVFRLNADGSIPSDNPFYNQTTGDYRAIYALGLRNPYSMSKHPETGVLYINEARGTNKADIYIVEAGANYQHEGDDIGNVRDPWANASGGGGELITGGAWYPAGGPFPEAYHGSYFTAMWGSNSSASGQINYIRSNTDTTAASFETNVGLVGSNGLDIKPVITRIGPDGNLYYMLTTYTTESGTIQMVRYSAQETVATPLINPAGGTFEDPVTVSLSTATAGATIYYTTNSANPTTESTLYTGPFEVSTSMIVKARALAAGLNGSGTASALFTIGDTVINQPPIVDAGADQIVTVGDSVSLDGSATTDPDGDDNFLTGEQWEQLSGPAVEISDASEEVAFFSPTQPGTYRFRLTMSDTRDVASDEVTITVFASPRAGADLIAMYTFYEGVGNTVSDVSGNGEPLDLTIANGSAVRWGVDDTLTVTSGTTISSGAAATKINNACRSASGVTLEAWISAASLDQTGPARIVSLSQTTLLRNMTLAQEGDEFDARIRTTGTNDNGEPSTRTSGNSVSTDLTHVVFVWESGGTTSIYVDGTLVESGTVTGDLSNWDAGYQLILGNEASNDRPWLGRYALVALYCSGLSDAEVRTNYDAALPFSEWAVNLYMPMSSFESDLGE